ncbi:GNAT family N-acetyltransferase [Pseudobdellovibrio sp. HCB154]|uniref:GNAT family N-acetyltransferase n=1 Tax=Pseudobdellovibrio sp. HCB154 TaxID=3386277 RepID=UPI003916DDB9
MAKFLKIFDHNLVSKTESIHTLTDLEKQLYNSTHMKRLLYSTNGIQFRYITTDDLEPLRVLHNDPSTLHMLTDTTYVTPEMQKRWHKSLYTSSKRGHYAIYAKAARENEKARIQLVGIARLDQIDSINKNMLLGLDIAPEFRGQGLGKKAFAALMKYGTTKLKMHKLTLYTAKYNKVAISMYTSLGFTKEGLLKQHLYRDGKFFDLFIMSYFKKASK